MDLFNHQGFQYLTNHIFEYVEGNVLSFEEKKTPRYSDLRLINKFCNKIILDKWDAKYFVLELVDEQIDKIQFVLECGGCSGCLSLYNYSGGENQLAHYGGCMADDYETEEEFQERINNLSIGDTKYIDYQDKKRKREEEFESNCNKKFCYMY